MIVKCNKSIYNKCKKLYSDILKETYNNESNYKLLKFIKQVIANRLKAFREKKNLSQKVQNFLIWL